MDKKKKNPVAVDNLAKVSGGKDKLTITTYTRGVEGNNNVVVSGTGEQLMNRFDELLNKGTFDNLR